MGLFLDAIETAKKLFSYDKDIIGKIEAAVHPAAQELKILIGKKEYCRFYNTSMSSSIDSVTDGTTAGYSVLHLTKFNINKFDDIVITGTGIYDGCYCDFTCDEVNKTVTIKADFVETKTGTITNELFKTYQMAFAWLICYYTTFAVQEVKKDKVLITSEEFGDGNIKTFSISDIIRQREDYLRNAQILVGRVEVRKL